jgi:hypothetical protein
LLPRCDRQLASYFQPRPEPQRQQHAAGVDLVNLERFNPPGFRIKDCLKVSVIGDADVEPTQPFCDRLFQMLEDAAIGVFRDAPTANGAGAAN